MGGIRRGWAAVVGAMSLIGLASVVPAAASATPPPSSSPGLSSPTFPQGPPNDPGYGPAEGRPPPCSPTSVNDEQFSLYSFIPQCAKATATDPEGASGMSVDKAWAKYTTGRPDTVIAYGGGGINWQHGDVADLVNNVYLNQGEPPVPCNASPCVTRHSSSLADYDLNHDGVLDAADYANDPRVRDVNGNGVIDPEDIIAAFSCY